VTPVATPDVQLPESHTAIVRGARLAYEGGPGPLPWPALHQALAGLGPRSSTTLEVDRGVPMKDLQRAAFALDQGDLRVQSKDVTGVLRAIEFGARRAGREGCHAAVFVRLDGTIRVASPGGGAVITDDDATEALVRALEREEARCPLKYLAFGAESDQAPWGPVFDVIVAVDRRKSSADVRYTLASAARPDSADAGP
jgi:hypothetical protein